MIRIPAAAPVVDGAPDASPFTPSGLSGSVRSYIRASVSAGRQEYATVNYTSHHATQALPDITCWELDNVPLEAEWMLLGCFHILLK